MGYSPWGHRESDTTERLSTHMQATEVRHQSRGTGVGTTSASSKSGDGCWHSISSLDTDFTQVSPFRMHAHGIVFNFQFSSVTRLLVKRMKLV